MGVWQRRRVVIIATFVIALVALPFILAKVRPTYVATSHVLMVGKDSMIPNADMSSLTMSETVIERIRKRFSLSATTGNIASRIDAKASQHSNVMPISFRDKDPKVSLAVTNALADETVRYYKELSGGQYDQMISYLTNTAQRDKEKVRSLDVALQQAAQRDTDVGSDTALETLTARIGELQMQRAVAYATMVSDQAIANAQSAQPAEIAGIVRQEVLAGNPYVQALRTGEARTAAQLDFQKAQYTDRFPGLPGLEDAVSREAAVLSAAEKVAVAGSPSSSSSYAATILAKRNAMAVAAGDQAKVKAIDDQIAVEQQHLRDLPGTGATVNLLRAEREGAKVAYAATIAKLSDTQANQAAAASLGAIVVEDRAVESAPRIARLAMDILVAFILLALTIGVAYLVDTIDPSLRSPEAIEKLYGLPIVGNLGSRR
jgi:succinoglycan biosynthesis transport protein ExoP